MAALTTRRFDFAASTPSEARSQINGALKSDVNSAGKIYSALAHRVWATVLERRQDSEVRDWHRLLQNIRSFVKASDLEMSGRFAALADILREQVYFAEISPAKALARRPQAHRILSILKESEGYVPRRKLREHTKLGESHLSNILTSLTGSGLVDRRGAGKEAEFCLTTLGAEIVGKSVDADNSLQSVISELKRLNLSDPSDRIGSGSHYPSSDHYFLNQKSWKLLKFEVTERPEFESISREKLIPNLSMSSLDTRNQPSDSQETLQSIFVNYGT